jgi:hypothetical protein
MERHGTEQINSRSVENNPDRTIQFADEIRCSYEGSTRFWHLSCRKVGESSPNKRNKLRRVWRCERVRAPTYGNLSKEVCREVGVNIQLYGFDIATGFPEPRGYKNLPYLWGSMRLDFVENFK